MWSVLRDKHFYRNVTALDDDDEEEEDDFYQLEAGASTSREDRPQKADKVHSNTLRGNFKLLSRSLSRTFTISRLHPTSSTRARVRRDNKRAKMKWFQLFLHDLKVAINRQRLERNEFKLFLKTIKTIQGELGSSTAALFLFVRYLLMINIFSSVLWVAFVVIPQAYHFDYAAIDNDDHVFASIQLFLGDGRVADSWLFFKGYSEKVESYPMYVMYLVVHFISIIGVFIGILKTIATDFIREGTASGDQEKSLALNVFTSWDYGINSQEAIIKQKKSLQSNFIDLICELTSLQKQRTKREIRILYVLRTLAWFIWAVLVAGAITAIIVIVDYSNKSEEKDFLAVYGPTVALTAINSAVPFLMQQLTHIENYDIGRTEQYVTIFRVYVMRMISLCTFIVTLIRESDSVDCPQLYWGQEFYKLCIINTISNTAVLLKYPAFDYLLGKKIEVDLPSSLMSLIYFQGCIWFGNLFCPLLCLMAAISNLIYFGVGSVVIKKCCTPPTKRYNSQNSKFFNSFLALTIIIMMSLTCFIIITQTVKCGPYASTKFDVMLDTFSVVMDYWPNNAQIIIHTIMSAVVVIPILFVLAVAIWLQHILISKHVVKNGIIWSELVLLRQEKSKYMKEKRHTPPPSKRD